MDILRKKIREIIIESEFNKPINCPLINITKEMGVELSNFKSEEDFLRGGGFSIEALDRAAYGFSSEDIKEIEPGKLNIKWKTDLENVFWEQKKSGLTPKEYALKISLEEPIDVSYEKGKFFIEDGHHRYFAAKVLRKPLKLNLEIKDNPIKKLAQNLNYDDFHRCAFRQFLNKNVDLKESVENVSSSNYSKLVDDLMNVLEQKYDVKLFIYYNKFANTIILSQIIVEKKDRNKGIGTKVMNEICNFADKNNLRIALTPSGDFGGSKSRLISFYKNFGFKNYKGYEFRESMVREPEKKMLKEDKNSFEIASKEDFNDALLDLATLDLEDSQVRYPKIDGKKLKFLFGSNNYDLYILDRKTLPSSGSFEIIIENNDEEIIGFIRGTKGGKIISFNLIHIKEEYRGSGIGTDIYEKFLNDGYIIKSDTEITDSTYSLYDKLVAYGYKPLIFNDGRVGLKK